MTTDVDEEEAGAEDGDMQIVGFVAQIMQASHAQSTHVVNQLLEAYDEDRKELAKTLVQLWDIIWDHEVLDRTTCRRVEAIMPKMAKAWALTGERWDY